MPKNAETTTVIEPRKLGLGCKALVALLVVLTAGLVVGAVVAFRARSNAAKRQQTIRILER